MNYYKNYYTNSLYYFGKYYKRKKVPAHLNEIKDKDEKEKAFSSENTTPYGEAIQLLIKSNDEFLVYEGDDDNKLDYTSDQFVDLYQQNLKSQSEKIAETCLR